jgi:hypothetical protein
MAFHISFSVLFHEEVNMLFLVLMHELPIYRGQNYNIFLDLRNKTISFFPLTFKYPLAAIPMPSKVPMRRANYIAREFVQNCFCISLANSILYICRRY